MKIEFHYGALAESLEEQANKQGYTFGNLAEWVEKVNFGLVCSRIHGVITDSEYDKIIKRFQDKILIKSLEKMEGGAENENRRIKAYYR